MRYFQSAVSAIVLAAPLAMAGSAQAAEDYPTQPIEFVCATAPGSGAATWCQLMAEELSKPDNLNTPISVVFKSAGNNHEPVVYTDSKPADGYTLMHVNGSFSGYFNLPHFTKQLDAFDIVAKVEQTLYGVSVRCDDPDIKSWDDLVAYAKANPGDLAMGSNKVGSIHHQNHVALYKAAGIDVRFVPYEGTGGVVKDVVGGHLRVGFAQPGLWNSHIEAGTICPLVLINETRLENDPIWKDVPTVRDAGLQYSIPFQWQGFLVKTGTPPEIEDKIADAVRNVTESDAYKTYLSNAPEVVPALETDRAKLKSDMEKAIKDAREFMIENDIIKG